MTTPWSQRHHLPVARTDDLVVSIADDEVLAYDQQAHHIHYLNPVSAAVWQACDGTRDVGDLAASVSGATSHPVNEETVRLALVQLDTADLLAAPLAPELTLARATRRSLLRKAGLVAVPAIISVSAPSAAVAQSTCVPLEAWEACEPGQCCMRDSNTSIGCCQYLGELGWGCGPVVTDPGLCAA